MFEYLAVKIRFKPV